MELTELLEKLKRTGDDELLAVNKVLDNPNLFALHELNAKVHEIELGKNIIPIVGYVSLILCPKWAPQWNRFILDYKTDDYSDNGAVFGVQMVSNVSCIGNNKVEVVYRAYVVKRD